MLNFDAVSSARNRLKAAAESYNFHLNTANEMAGQLFALRRSSSDELIGPIEKFVNDLAAVPKEFSRAFAEYRIELKSFDRVLEGVDARLHDIKINSSVGVGAGVAAGATTAVLGPTAAMAIATTFGTASTGTAIASLSGAAATNAALAWLGGGALAAGGSGMAAGETLLALAGPIGWAIAGVTAIGGAVYVAHTNGKVVDEVNAKLRPIEAGIFSLKAAINEIRGLYDLTYEHVNGMRRLFELLTEDAPHSYDEFTLEKKTMLAALINHVQSLSVLLNKTVQGNGGEKA
jgi:hypothetical protein